MTEPSKVVHIRGVNNASRESDFQLIAEGFGKIEKFVHIRAKYQVLMQFDTIEAATRFVEHCLKEPPVIRGVKLIVQFSSHQELSNQELPRRFPSDRDTPTNRILLISIVNPLYPISVDVLHQVFSPHGAVEKIVIFSKTAGLQALLQFSDDSSAEVAKANLQGRNIYDGCCTLDIQYSRLEDLVVNVNNELSRDFTNSSLPSFLPSKQRDNHQQQPPLFGDSGMYQGRQLNDRSAPFHHGGAALSSIGQQYPMGPSLLSSIFGHSIPPGLTGHNDCPTVLVSKINHEKVDHKMLFNLFSCYGNVMRIKFLNSKPDHALIEFAEPLHAELAHVFLKGALLFGSRLDVAFSRHAHVIPSLDSHDYSASNLHRFSRQSVKNFRHCSAPTATLHCSNLPSIVTPEALTELLLPYGSIVGVSVYDKEDKKQAHVEFSSPAEATEALVCQHSENFLGMSLRLAFSKSHAQPHA